MTITKKEQIGTEKKTEIQEILTKYETGRWGKYESIKVLNATRKRIRGSLGRYENEEEYLIRVIINDEEIAQMELQFARQPNTDNHFNKYKLYKHSAAHEIHDWE